MAGQSFQNGQTLGQFFEPLYVSAIHTHRALDGYNTESPEHLHIDFAKIPFRAGNKQDYTAQITTWMSCHDAVWHYGSFLHWAKGEGITKKRERIIERGEDDDNDGEEPKRKWQRRDNCYALALVSTTLRYRLFVSL